MTVARRSIALSTVVLDAASEFATNNGYSLTTAVEWLIMTGIRRAEALARYEEKRRQRTKTTRQARK